MFRAGVGVLTVYVAMMGMYEPVQAADMSAQGLSLGTLVGCDGTRCLWADANERAVSNTEMMRQFLESEQLDMEQDVHERRRLEHHVKYIEDVVRHGRDHGIEFPYRMGVNERHLYLDDARTQTPHEFVQQEVRAMHRRRLEMESAEQRPKESSLSRELAALPTTLNWCTTDNPLNRTVCTTVKSQNRCGSCWAFAASDAIETAVSVNSGTTPLALSPQQFLDCSRREMTATFNYCWAANGVSGSSWLLKEMKWASQNNGCDGGMTHGAFADAALLQLGLLSELVLPYTETTTGLSLVPGITSTKTNAPKTEAERNASCVHGMNNASATISDWKQAVGSDCSKSSDPTQLLKLALQTQPISVAINSGSAFKDYKGGIYTCPNNGDFADSSKVDHAIVLVGYGRDGSDDYWILKNSYGFSWGEQGFLRLKMDSKLNCGVNVFPVIPLGAAKGGAKLVVQGGGDHLLLGLSPFMWIATAAVVTIATTVLTAFGVVVHQRRRSALKKDAVMG